MSTDAWFKAAGFSFCLTASFFLSASPLRAKGMQVSAPAPVAAPTPKASAAVPANPTPVPPANALPKSKGIEVESDDDMDFSSPATAMPATVQAKPAPKPIAVPMEDTAEPPAENATAQPRARISDNVGFYYFVKAGYVAESSTLHPIGKVAGSFDYNQSFSLPKTTFVESFSNRVKVSPDDLLVVYRTVNPIGDSQNLDPDYQVENLAIVKVIEVQKNRYRVKVIKSFYPFKEGDLVEAYDIEIQRWKQAQTKKPLPTHPVNCKVAGGVLGQRTYNQLDFIFLSAGTKKGVVEGQVFQLKEAIDTGFLQDSARKPHGQAQIIYAGPEYSTAQILFNDEPIGQGFEAVYQSQ